MRVVVTGGAGFIGANVVRALEGCAAIGEVVVVDDLSTGDAANLEGTEAQLEVGSVLDPALLDRAMTGAAAVVHLAAWASVPRSVDDPLGCHEANVTGALQVLEAARRAGGVHMILASSAAVYGDDPASPQHEGLVPSPRSPYAASKLAAEAHALAHAACYGTPVLALRFFNVYGPFQPADHVYAAAVPAFVDAVLAGRPVPVHGDGLQTRDFVFVGDVAEVIVDAVVRGVRHPGPVNLAFGTRHTLLEVVAEIGAVLGDGPVVVHEPTRPGDVRDSQADHRRLRALFPTIEPVGLRDGLRATITWWTSQGVR